MKETDRKINMLMGEEQKKLLVKLSSITPESDEYEVILNRIEVINAMLSDGTKCDKELELKREQLEEQKKDRYLKYGVDAGLGLLTLAFYGTWMKKGFKFEETGALCSGTFKNLISNFKPKRR